VPAVSFFIAIGDFETRIYFYVHHMLQALSTDSRVSDDVVISESENLFHENNM